MQDALMDALSIIGAGLLIALVAIALIVLRPSARRRRRHRRRTRRPRIDLFAPRDETPAEPDA